jgi:hypothetical protein
MKITQYIITVALVLKAAFALGAAASPMEATVSFAPVVLAQISSIQPKVDQALQLIQLLLLPVVVCLILFGAYCIHEGKIREGILAIVGALILALAVPIAKALMNP